MSNDQQMDSQALEHEAEMMQDEIGRMQEELEAHKQALNETMREVRSLRMQNEKLVDMLYRATLPTREEGQVA